MPPNMPPKCKTEHFRNPEKEKPLNIRGFE